MMRTIRHDQDLILMILLCLDNTGHGLAPGSVGDVLVLASDEALEVLKSNRFVGVDDKGTLDLTDEGRAEARAVASRLGGAP